MSPLLRFAIDSNVLIYAEGTDDMRRRNTAVEILRRIDPQDLVLPMQVLGETLRWLIGKARVGKTEAVARIEKWFVRCHPLPVSISAFRQATTLVERHSFQIWDAVILAASAEAQVSILLSEDMQHGFEWNGVTIVNPFVLTSAQLRTLVPPRTMH